MCLWHWPRWQLKNRIDNGINLPPKLAQTSTAIASTRKNQAADQICSGAANLCQYIPISQQHQSRLLTDVNQIPDWQKRSAAWYFREIRS